MAIPPAAGRGAIGVSCVTRKNPVAATVQSRLSQLIDLTGKGGMPGEPLYNRHSFRRLFGRNGHA
jgi:hypothetical protein